MRVFNFDPNQYAKQYASEGYVHIPHGVDSQFLTYAQKHLQELLAKEEEKSLDEWEIKGKKIQFLFDFPNEVNFHQDVKNFVGRVADLPEDNVTLCERHLKVYVGEAPSNPPPHKDRVASQLTVGLPLQVPDDSYLILYPQQQRDINPFSTTALYRSSLDEDVLPEHSLADVEPVKLEVWPGDVVFFKGSSIYHERVNPANNSLLYLKFNGMYLDPLGEDPETIARYNQSQTAIGNITDDDLLEKRIMVSPRVEKISRHYSRLHWKEVVQVYLWGQKEITIDDYQQSLITNIADGITSAEALARTGLDSFEFAQSVPALRRLIKLGVIDLL